ncbi:MAG TPA: hypothetical protein VFU06_04170 [Longimicrobiales bacterium]|nr:hypothetical protein [Longimicrobiales bacterium]
MMLLLFAAILQRAATACFLFVNTPRVGFDAMPVNAPERAFDRINPP